MSAEAADPGGKSARLLPRDIYSYSDHAPIVCKFGVANELGISPEGT